MYAFVFKDYNGEFDIYQSVFIGDKTTRAMSDIGLFVIYVAM